MPTASSHWVPASLSQGSPSLPSEGHYAHPEEGVAQHSLSGVQSVKRGTNSGTLSMFCRWGRTWWMPRGSLAWRKQRCQ